jgi:DNA-binding MarR family transcriptional regulator
MRTVGPRSMGELGEQLGIDRSTMVQLVDGLEAKGLVERQRNPADRRSYALTITPAGTEMWQRARGDVERSEDDILDGMSEEDRDALRRLLAQVVQAQERALPAAGD